MSKELQAAPAQGSIDTDAFWVLIAKLGRAYPGEGYQKARTELLAHIDAHIAQRAASGDVADLMAVAEACAAQRCTIAMEDWLEARQAAPAPIADEVAGEWVLVPIAPTEEMILATRGPNMSEPSWNSYARKRHATLYKQMIAARPPAPRTSAPDAPAGGFPPLPERTHPFFKPEYSADDMHAYVLADRTARATAAPAGHAEPVARLHIRLEEDGLTCDIEVLNGGNLQVEHSPVDVYLAAPVAAEPAVNPHPSIHFLLCRIVQDFLMEESELNSVEFDAIYSRKTEQEVAEEIYRRVKQQSTRINEVKNEVLEEAATICDNLHHDWRWDEEPDSASGPRSCATAIRAEKSTNT